MNFERICYENLFWFCQIDFGRIKYARSKNWIIFSLFSIWPGIGVLIWNYRVFGKNMRIYINWIIISFISILLRRSLMLEFCRVFGNNMRILIIAVLWIRNRIQRPPWIRIQMRIQIQGTQKRWIKSGVKTHFSRNFPDFQWFLSLFHHYFGQKTMICNLNK